MKFVFFGTPSFAARTLNILLEQGYIPSTVVCNPDRPAGRKKIITPPPVKTMTQEWSEKSGREIEILQPEKLDAAFAERLRSLKPDFFVVFAYNKIFRKNILDIPRLGTIGIHPSFLPKYRGPSPFQSALLNGDLETGVTLYLLDEGVDSGSIIAQSKPIEITIDENFESLADKLADMAAELFIATIDDFLTGKVKPLAQDPSKATYTKKFKTEDGFIKPNDLHDAQNGSMETAQKMVRKINAFNPEPSAWTMKDGKRLKLLKAKIEDGRLALLETQKEGERSKKL